MEFKADTKLFKEALSRVAGAANKTTTMPILGSVLIRSKSDGVEISATDLNVSITTECEAKIAKPGALCLSSKGLLDIARSVGGSEIKLKQGKSNSVAITSAKSRFRVVGLDPESFPTIPNSYDIDLVPVDPEDVARLIDSTSYACSDDASRPNLCGVFFAAESGKLRMVATDGKRLALSYADTAWAFDDAIVPKSPLINLRKLLGASDTLSFGFSGSNLFARVDNASMSIRLIDGRFPDYNQIIPKEKKTSIILDCAPIKESLKRVALMSDSKLDSVVMEFSEKSLQLSTSDANSGDAQEDIGIAWSGDPLTVAFSIRYLLDAIDACQAEGFEFALDGPSTPAVVESASAKAVIMPMRV